LSQTKLEFTKANSKGELGFYDKGLVIKQGEGDLSDIFYFHSSGIRSHTNAYFDVDIACGRKDDGRYNLEWKKTTEGYDIYVY
jgi:hypothetical protein